MIEIQKIESITIILSNVATAYGVGRGLFWLGSFVKQRRVENLCINAKEALNCLITVEELIKQLYFLHKNTIKDPNSTKNHDHLQLHIDISKQLNQLHVLLLLVSIDENLKENPKVSSIIETINVLGRILNGRYSLQSYTSIDFLIEGKFIDSNHLFNIDLLENVKIALVEIYHLNSKTWWQKVKDYFHTILFLRDDR